MHRISGVVAEFVGVQSLLPAISNLCSGKAMDEVNWCATVLVL